ncbi:MAG: DUF4254 domain-containing protein [Bacteroidetes bacterium]|nr:DUF4254 domain-containing protein [Bacteroidota bacterium]
MMNAERCNEIFLKSIADYHKYDNINQPIDNPYEEGNIKWLLYLKNWIDTIQWHLEDLIRDPDISAEEAVKLKRRIDHSNQERNDTVEKIDNWFMEAFKDIKKKENTQLNSESPGLIIDRLSILALKVYHMQEQVNREDAGKEHSDDCQVKLKILLEQQKDLSQCFNELIEDIKSGIRYMSVYRQMKMYNDPSLNPILYSKDKSSQ